MMRTIKQSVTTYENATRHEIQGAIIEADWNLIGLGLMDLDWHDFCSELLARGYTKISEGRAGSVLGDRWDVDVWQLVSTDDDDDAAEVSGGISSQAGLASIRSGL